MIKNAAKINQERSAEELKQMLERKDQALTEMRNRAAMLEKLLKSRGVAIPEGAGVVVPGAGAGAAGAAGTSISALVDELEHKRQANFDTTEKIAEIQHQCDDLRRQLQAAESEKRQLQSRQQDQAENDERSQQELDEAREE